MNTVKSYWLVHYVAYYPGDPDKQTASENVITAFPLIGQTVKIAWAEALDLLPKIVGNGQAVFGVETIDNDLVKMGIGIGVETIDNDLARMGIK